MPERLSQIPKTDAKQFEKNRKLFLVPMFALPPDAPAEGQQLLESYWTEVREHVENLERTLSKVKHVYHEAVFVGGQEGIQMIDEMNPKGASFIHAMCHSDANLEAAEDKDALQESSDWQRCISVGLMSQKVFSTAIDGFQESTKRRYEFIGAQIDQTLQPDQSGVLFIRDDHSVQFPSDVSVFYVAPPSLDSLKRWIQEQIRSTTQFSGQTGQEQGSDE